MSLRLELTQVFDACELARKQLFDDVTLLSVDRAAAVLTSVAESYGTIWLYGNNFGKLLAEYTAALLMHSASEHHVARTLVLGGRHVPPDEELAALAKTGDAIWCFIGEADADEACSVLSKASEFGLQRVLFTTYPGVPIITYCDYKVRLPAIPDDPLGVCTGMTYMPVIKIVCGAIRRAVKLKIRADKRKEK